MPTSTELKTAIDTALNSSVPDFSITPEIQATQIKSVVDYVDQEIEAIPNTVGPQGIQGPAGPPGPVGPAGLEWKGQWVDTSDYNLNDAVGYSGASYFCINAIEGDPSNQDPETDTSTWALLASQGAIGPQGAQGPQGEQGPQGVAPVKTFGNIEATSSAGSYPVISNDLCLVISQGNGRRVVLPQSQPVGKEIIIYAGNTSFSFLVQNGQLSTPALSPEGVQSYVSAFQINPNRNYKFTSLGGDFWKIEELSVNKKIIYRVRITQTGTNNPSITVIENNTIRSYSATRVSAGQYRFTPSLVLPSNINVKISFNSPIYAVPNYTVDNQINYVDIFTRYWDGSDFVLSDNVINNSVFELELL
jgi:hypothetical protein